MLCPTNKMMFKTKQLAKEAMKKHPRCNRVFHCNFCAHWHITKQRRR